MKSKLLVSTAALLAGLAYASAQQMPEGAGGAVQRQQSAPPQGAPSPGAQSKGEQGKAQRQTSGQSDDGAMKGKQGKRERQTTGKSDDASSKGKQAQPKQGKAQTTGQSDKAAPSKSKQAQPKPDKAQTTGQGQGAQDKSKQTQRSGASKSQSDQTTGQGTQRNRDQAGTERTRDQAGTQSDTARTQTGSRTEVNLSVEQRTRIRQTVLASRNAPRVTSVNFAVNVGTVVPSRVRVAAVPRVVIDIYPQFRNHMYFVVRDEIVIIDRSRHIVAVIAADGAPSQARGGGGAAVMVDLSPDEIRMVQTVLIERGFLIGVADGEFGPRTRDALVRFQRKEGITVSGRIDTRTVASLGLSAKIDASKTGGQTQGQGSAGSTSRQPATTGGGQSSQPATTGQQAPAASGQSSTNGQKGSGSSPATSGQGQGQQSQQPPAQKQAPAKGSDAMPSNRPPQSSGSGAASGSAGGSAQ